MRGNLTKYLCLFDSIIFQVIFKVVSIILFLDNIECFIPAEIKLIKKVQNYVISIFGGFTFLKFIITFYPLSYCSCPDCSSFSPSNQQSLLPQAIPTPLFTSMGHVNKFLGYSTSYAVLFISPWLLWNYLLVLLNPLTSSPIPLHLPPVWQPSKCSLYLWLCLCSCLLSLFFRFNCW